MSATAINENIFLDNGHEIACQNYQEIFKNVYILACITSIVIIFVTF